LPSMKLDRRPAAKAAQTSYNPPLPPDDHWGLDSPLPKYEKVYVLKRSNGVVRSSLFIISRIKNK
uniref:MBD domain-containing protein n=1 Tax=Gongylonema pulchrum TaxID=637853 RepID=A0A183D9L7_9BILA